MRKNEKSHQLLSKGQVLCQNYRKKWVDLSKPASDLFLYYKYDNFVIETRKTDKLSKKYGKERGHDQKMEVAIEDIDEDRS